MNKLASFGVLLVNLGTPQAPTPIAIRRYLREFLSDRRVVDLPRILWLPILYGFVLPIRPFRLAKAYQTIWTKEGSPLTYYSQQQCKKLTEKLASLYDPAIPVALAMNYGQPSLAKALTNLQAQHVNKLLLIPLYPQFSHSTHGAVFDQYARIVANYTNLPELRIIRSFADYPLYIEALAENVEQHWRKLGRQGHLLLSYHGIPQRYIKEGDPYLAQCQLTSQLLTKRLKLKDEQWTMAFQSRFGWEPWLQPYTNQTLKNWAHNQRYAQIDVISPAFVADCLETLEELNLQNRHLYQKYGGGEYHYIAALNDQPNFINMLVALVRQHSQGW